VCNAAECELLHTRGLWAGIKTAKGEPCRGNATLSEDERREAMNRAFRQACARLELTGATPVVELVAVRILELVRDGESNPDRLTEATVSTFER
jgi:hypothetical protein